MKILHIAAHLGGGIGKAHAAMAPHIPKDVEQIFALLEMPIDRRHVDAVMKCGAKVCIGSGRREISAMAEHADIVQFEYWGHPGLDKILDGWELPFIPHFPPSVCWCHVSGLHTPLPWQLLDGVDRFVATSPITLPVLPECMRAGAQVINSGFGFEGDRRQPHRGVKTVYLGTVDFKKLHPDFFGAINSGIERGALDQIDIWGHVSAAAEEARRNAPYWREIKLRGHTLDPASALADCDIFFYPLRPDHYGTAENALVEAMSLGLVPVVLNNPAEMAIVTHGKTGIVATSLERALWWVDDLTRKPDLFDFLSRNAMVEVARTKSPRVSAMQFVDLWRNLLSERRGDIRAYG